MQRLSLKNTNQWPTSELVVRKQFITRELPFGLHQHIDEFTRTPILEPERSEEHTSELQSLS